MSENRDEEIITKNPLPTETTTQSETDRRLKSKVKDPKMVAAGKRLAEYNKKAKEKVMKESAKEE